MSVTTTYTVPWSPALQDTDATLSVDAEPGRGHADPAFDAATTT